MRSHARLLLLHSRKLQSRHVHGSIGRGLFVQFFGSSFQFINTTGILGDSQSRFCFCHIQHIPIDTPLPHTLLKCNRMRRDAHPSPTFRTQLRRSRARATTQLTTAVLLLCPLLPASAHTTSICMSTAYSAQSALVKNETCAFISTC